ncbi:MAG: lipoprotein, partial [Bacteroidota bacterium]|nr:lipoprotein [Bacteroidota bacterium]
MFKKLILFLCLCIVVLSSFAQDKKYQGLLWEITGNGMDKPSYLYGTMHVSNKVAFHLSEPFFSAINNSTEVALEVDPDTWLEEFAGSDNFLALYYTNFYFRDYAYLDPFEKSLDIKRKLKETVKTQLADDPELINSFMFRSDKSKSDFQENTYLDLYIYQTAKKMGKNVFGLETVAELDRDSEKSNKAKAHEDHSVKSGKNSYTWNLGDKLEEYYRRGDLYELDSINQLMSTDSVREYIVYKRNVLMVDRMLKAMKQHPLFTGVGAAHLPGEKGILELLKSKGYSVRAIEMGDNDSERKEKLENKIVERQFTKFVTPDSLISVDVPDKMFCFKEEASDQNYLCADMINGTYFTISRIKSYAAINHYSEAKIQKIVDSLIYENVPGKIIEQKNIDKNGVPGIYILNKTRKGDFQAYNIYFTPDEILIFKVSGTNENAKSEYGQRFLKSIELNLNNPNQWHQYTTRNNSFSVLMPANPVSYIQSEREYVGNKIDLLALDKKTGNSYALIRTTISNPDYFEEDTFEISMMAEDFGKKNDFKEKKRWLEDFNGRKALKALYVTPDSQSVAAMFIAQNLNFYALAVFYTTDSSMNDKYFKSFEMHNPSYSNFHEFTDSILHFKVSLPYKHIANTAMKTFSYGSIDDNPVKHVQKTETFTPPGSFETVEVGYNQYCPYDQVEDTATFIRRRRKYASYSGDFLVKRQTVHMMKDSMLIVDFLFADTNSTRQIHERAILKNGVRYILSAYVDTLLGESKYVQTFFETFRPSDTVIGTNFFADHTHLFLKDILSTDSLTRVHALEQTEEPTFGNSTAQSLMDAFQKIPKSTSYLEIKTELFKRFEDIKGKAVLPFLEKAYKDAGDTSQFQFAILTSLAKMKTADAITLYGKLITSEPPLSDDQKDFDRVFAPLYDSLLLAKTLYPELLDLMPIEEYKYQVFTLLANLVDSNQVKPAVYKNYKGIILNQAKLEIKREAATIKSGNSEKDDNYKLQNFATLLLPFYKENAV